MKINLLAIIMFLLTGCVSASGEPVVVLTQSEYDKHIRGAVIAGEYAVCLRLIALTECRSGYHEKFNVNGKLMTQKERNDHTHAVTEFIESLYGDSPELEFEQWEQWNLQR